MGLPESRSSEFNTTHWTLIAATSGRDRQRGLDHIYRAYSPPLRAYLQRFGVSRDDEDDVLHEFLLAVFESGTLERADPVHGRFRSYLLGTLRNFLSHRRARACASKRGNGAPSLSLDELRPEAAPGTMDDDRRFDEDWAHALFDHAVTRLNEELDRDTDRSTPPDLRDLIFREQSESYLEIARRLRITVPAVKSRIFRLRKRFQEIIRSEISRTVESEADCDAELSYLCSVLSNPAQSERHREDVSRSV